MTCRQPLKNESSLYTYNTGIRDVLSHNVTSEGGMTVGDAAGLSSDQRIWVERIAEKLTETKEWDTPETKARALKVRGQLQKELTDCLMGDGDFNKWFDTTRTKLGLHTRVLTQILHESLTGLRSQEAQELKKQYGQSLQKMM